MSGLPNLGTLLRLKHEPCQILHKSACRCMCITIYVKTNSANPKSLHSVKNTDTFLSKIRQTAMAVWNGFQAGSEVQQPFKWPRSAVYVGQQQVLCCRCPLQFHRRKSPLCCQTTCLWSIIIFPLTGVDTQSKRGFLGATSWKRYLLLIVHLTPLF